MVIVSSEQLNILYYIIYIYIFISFLNVAFSQKKKVSEKKIFYRKNFILGQNATFLKNPTHFDYQNIILAILY